MPVVQGRQVLVRVVFSEILRQGVDRRLAAVVALAARLVGEVDEGVPLGGALGVEFHFVIEAVHFHRGVVEVDDFVDEAFAAEAGGLDGADGPVERDGCAWVGVLAYNLPIDMSEEEECLDLALTICGFLQRVLYDLGCKEIETTQMIFLAVLVEDTPGAALWHAFDGRQRVEVGDVGVVGHGGGVPVWSVVSPVNISSTSLAADELCVERREMYCLCTGSKLFFSLLSRGSATRPR